MKNWKIDPRQFARYITKYAISPYAILMKNWKIDPRQFARYITKYAISPYAILWKNGPATVCA